MPKTKSLLKDNKKRSKHAPRLPSTVEEYLEDGVEFEEAGEKWRGGDAVKSTRFFVRAINCYDEGLKKFPSSFDLAYNKARIQFELTQYPKLLQHLPGSLFELLETALQSTRWALKLNPDDANTLFNTAQILTNIFEVDEQAAASKIQQPLQLLEEALQLLNKCLVQQEAQARISVDQQAAAVEEDMDETMDADDTEDGGVSLSDSSSAPPQDDRWATIVEPVTNDTILDTLLIQLETLTSLVKALPPGQIEVLEYASNYAASILDERFAKYLTETNRELEAFLGRANFTCAFTEFQFLSGLMPISSYTTKILSAYSALDLSGHAKGLCDLAESMLSFNSAVSEHPEGTTPSILNQRWKALSLALQNFSRASKLNETDFSPIFNLPKIHLRRGDCELLRCQLGRAGFEPANANAGVLLKNAFKFYTGAELNAKQMGLEDEVKEALLKAALVKGLQGERDTFHRLMRETSDAASHIGRMIDEILQDGLLTREQLAALQE